MEGYEHVQRVRSRGLKTADLSYQGGRPNIRPKDKLKRPPSRLSNPSNVRAVNKFFENGRVGAHRMNTPLPPGGLMMPAMWPLDARMKHTLRL